MTYDGTNPIYPSYRRESTLEEKIDLMLEYHSKIAEVFMVMVENQAKLGRKLEELLEGKVLHIKGVVI